MPAQNKAQNKTQDYGENAGLKNAKNCQDLKDMLEYYEAHYPNIVVDLKNLPVFGEPAPRRNNIKNTNKPGRDTIYSWDEECFLIRPNKTWRLISRDQYKGWAKRPVVVRRTG